MTGPAGRWTGNTSICSGVHMSRSMDLTRLMCVPIPRWMPEHRMQRYTPLEMHGNESRTQRHDGQRVLTGSTRPTAGLCVCE